MSSIQKTNTGTEQSVERQRSRARKEEDTTKETSEQVALYATDPSIKWIRGGLIGSGSFGDVYLGMDAPGGRLMAVKQIELKALSNEENVLNTFCTEIELWKTLRHENVVQCFDSAVEEGVLNIFLEYAPGGSVACLVQAYGAFEESLAANWVRQVLCGLEFLHEHMIVHKNIKSSNVLVNNMGVVKISDPILTAKKFEVNELVRQRSVFYTAPESVQQTAHTSTVDIWSVGCVTIEMLTSHHPFHELTPMQALFTLENGVPPAIPSIDITEFASDFLKKTFELDYSTRPSATVLMRHSWLAES